MHDEPNLFREPERTWTHGKGPAGTRRQGNPSSEGQETQRRT